MRVNLAAMLADQRGAFAEGEALGIALGEQGGRTGAQAALRCALAIDPTGANAQAALCHVTAQGNLDTAALCERAAAEAAAQ